MGKFYPKNIAHKIARDGYAPLIKPKRVVTLEVASRAGRTFICPRCSRDHEITSGRYVKRGVKWCRQCALAVGVR